MEDESSKTSSTAGTAAMLGVWPWPAAMTFRGLKSTPVDAPEPFDPLKDRELHDLLIVEQGQNLYRYEVTRKEPDVGKFQSRVNLVRPEEQGARKVINISGENTLSAGSGGGNDTAGEVAFALLPIKEEPATSYFCCYLVHTPLFWQQAERVRLIEQAGAVWDFDAPKQRSDRLPRTASRPYTADGDPPGLEVALRSEEKQFTIDASKLDFVNPWTAADWSGVETKGRRYVLGTDPSSVRILWQSKGSTRMVRLDGADVKLVDALSFFKGVDKKDLQIPPYAILGTLEVGAERVAFINIDQLNAQLEDVFCILLALPDGSIVSVDHRNGVEPRRLTREELAENPELWRMLRNGCVLGRVPLYGRPTEKKQALIVNLCSLVGEGEPKSDTVEVSGTLDFKWPLDGMIVVRFKDTSGVDGAEEAKEVIASAFENWTQGTSLQGQIEIKTAKNEEVTDSGHETLPYEILISLEALPATVKATKQRTADRVVGLPVSAVGTYALRRDYAQPTMYLGRPEGDFVEGAEYFASDAFQHFVLHEVGHALGLPHLHQHPDMLPGPFRDESKVKSSLEEAFGLGIQLADEFLQEELFRRWSRPEPGDHSQWPRVTGNQVDEPASLLQASVMMGPPVPSIYRGSNESAEPDYKNDLGNLDREWIRQLYPPAPAQTAS